MKKQVVLTRKELNEYIDKQADTIIEKILNNKNRISENRKRFKTEERLTNRIFESMIRKMGLKKSVKLNESIGDGLFVEVRFVQGGDDDYNEIEQMFCGEQDGYCKANSQPVIDYLKQWDDGENEPTPNQPRIARGDTQYADKNGDYILLYNSSVGGCFLLYRPATEQEIAWYNDNGPGSMSESKKYLKESKNPKGELEDALNNVLGILHAYNDTEFGIDKKDFETLYETISDITNKINNSYDYGPYEGEPYHFGY